MDFVRFSCEICCRELWNEITVFFNVVIQYLQIPPLPLWQRSGVIDERDEDGGLRESGFCHPQGPLQQFDGGDLWFVLPVIQAKREEDGCDLRWADRTPQ